MRYENAYDSISAALDDSCLWLRIVFMIATKVTEFLVTLFC